ncbi:MAG: 30S ribosomal protein S8 [Candidatus Methanofastidiosa archaeon]|nr:30S ribosomal protein S8 [Candidatus Methanofastidiosa archaeon]
MLNDPLADALSNISNQEKVRKNQCMVPASKTIGNVLHILQKYGFVGAFELIDDGKSGNFKVDLMGNINLCGVIKPRYAVKKGGYESFERRYLPARGFGILVVSTPNGVMSHHDAQEAGLGGRLLAYVY